MLKRKKMIHLKKNDYASDEKEPICPYAAPGLAERVVIDKMAPFVFQHGARFELTVRERENNNNIFEFLKPFSKYHAFYKWRIGFLRQKFTIDKDALDRGLAESSDTLISQFREIAEVVKVEEQAAKKKDAEDQVKKDKIKKAKLIDSMNIKHESEDKFTGYPLVKRSNSKSPYSRRSYSRSPSRSRSRSRSNSRSRSRSRSHSRSRSRSRSISPYVRERRIPMRRYRSPRKGYRY